MDEEKCRRFINLSGIYIALWELSVACLQIKSWSECHQNFIHDRGFWLEPIPLLLQNFPPFFAFVFTSHTSMQWARCSRLGHAHILGNIEPFNFQRLLQNYFYLTNLDACCSLVTLLTLLTLLGVENIVFVISFGSRVLYALRTLFLLWLNRIQTFLFSSTRCCLKCW